MSKETPKYQQPDAPLAPGYTAADHHIHQRVTPNDKVREIESRFHGVRGTEDDAESASDRNANTEDREVPTADRK